MPRTNDTLVRAIITTTVADTAPYISAANIVVDALSSSSCGSGLVDDTLTKIETWLSAHIISTSGVQTEQQIKSEKFEGASKTFNSQMTGHGVMGSSYGQTANLLSGGCLAKMDLKKSSVVFF